jgi:hypothetical protein
MHSVYEREEMRCSGCGKRISYSGDACPNCGRDRAGDRKKRVLALSGTVAGGVIGSGVAGPLGILVGLFLGGAAGTLVGLVKYGEEKYLQKTREAGRRAGPVVANDAGSRVGVPVGGVAADSDQNQKETM